jgi:beta-galactosidase/beta-glucuronidase
VNQHLHPQPMLERQSWRSLDGLWTFAFDNDARWSRPDQVNFDHEILLPFAPESRTSGLHDQDFHKAVWYRQVFHLAAHERPSDGSRLLLHFGAVDEQACVWANGQQVATHQGGFTPFSADLTDVIRDDTLEIVVRAFDDPHDLEKPRGKQDWQREPHSIWYPRTTGIWQTVWLEVIPETRIEGLSWTAQLHTWQIDLEAQIAGPIREGMSLHVRLLADDRVLADDRYALNGSHISRTIRLPDPGIDDARAALLWSPEHPQLIRAELEIAHDQTVLDRVSSYTAMREVAVKHGRFLLNGRPYYLRMALDQGYWTEGLMTASDEQLKADVELARQLGFNGLRKHQKIESSRWLYWCDVLGMLVWNEMPSAYSFSKRAVERLTSQWLEVIRRDASHPCVVAWVPFNESWGVPDLPSSRAQREYVQGIAHLTRSLDPSRPISGNDGWEQFETDILSIHDYTPDPELLLERYRDNAVINHTLEHVQPALRVIALDGFSRDQQAVMLTEFGGIAFSPSSDGWGYSRAEDSGGFIEHYTRLLEAVHESTGLAGFCYTQLTDTFQEKNGLVYMDRRPKADLEAIARATRGPNAQVDFEINPMGYSSRWLKAHPEIKPTSLEISQP